MSETTTDEKSQALPPVYSIDLYAVVYEAFSQRGEAKVVVLRIRSRESRRGSASPPDLAMICRRGGIYLRRRLKGLQTEIPLYRSLSP